MGATPNEGLLVRTALNAVIEVWGNVCPEHIGQGNVTILGGHVGNPPTGGDQEITKRQNCSSKIVMVKKEEEDDAALASKERKQQGKKKRDLSKVRCFNCGEIGHFASTCPKKKDKRASDSKAATTKDDGSNDDAAMSSHMP